MIGCAASMSSRAACGVRWRGPGTRLPPGRRGGARRREKIPARSLVRIALTPVLPIVYTGAIARSVAQRRYHTGRALASAPYIVGFLGVRAVAEVVGYFAGVGDSPSRFD